MSLLFALALFVSPSRAGVVMPVDGGAVPTELGSPAVSLPAIAPAGSALTGPSLGASFDLRGAFPLLPSPVPGLAGPALNFVGENHDAAAVQPQNEAASVAPAPALGRPARAAASSPTMPAKPVPGASSPVVRRDRSASADVPENSPTSSHERAGDAAAHPFVETSALAHALPETAAGAGRRFFDQSRESGRGTFEGRPGSERPSPENATKDHDAAAPTATGGAAGPAALQASGSSAGGLRAAARDGSFAAPEGEILHDAVGALPSGAPSAGGVSFFRAAAPNGALPSAFHAEGFSVIGAPSPLSLDLSGSGLIVRVRAALGSVLPAAAVSELPLPRPVAEASTALLERGAMLEAFSVARAYAGETATPASRSADVAAARSVVPFTPLPSSGDPSRAPLWWALFVLPLLAVAVLGIL